MRLNIQETRSAKNYTLKEQILRILWGAGWAVFRIIPRPFNRPRLFILRLFGAEIGENAVVSNSARIKFPWNLEIGEWSSVGEGVILYNLGKINIGRSVTVSQHSHLCAGSHDYTDPSMPLLKLPITIEDNSWICADAFVGPNVTIGEGAVVGARAVVTKNVKAWSVVTGNPAKFIKKRELKNG